MAPRMSRFRGYRSIWSMCLTFALKGPRISTFRRRNPLELETPNLDWVFDGPDGVPSERTRNPRADRAPGRLFSFRANQQKPSSDLRPPLSGRSIPLHFFKAHVRQQKLQPPAIGPWRRPFGFSAVQFESATLRGPLMSDASQLLPLIWHYAYRPKSNRFWQLLLVYSTIY